MKMHNPPHPGLTIRDDILPELNISVGAAAEYLGLHRTTFSRVINGHASITPDLAIRLSQWLGIDAEQWLRLQVKFDLWNARKTCQVKIRRFQAAKSMA
jgi:addiction module HigA family antidote